MEFVWVRVLLESLRVFLFVGKIQHRERIVWNYLEAYYSDAKR